MSISAQTFPTDLILPSLVSWFNSQETSSRSISDTDVALFRVRVILDANGQARMVVGDAPYTAEGSEYICEATFMWCGARGDNLTANTTSFFEISKFLPQQASTTPEPEPTPAAQPLRVQMLTGTVHIPKEVAVQLTFRMAYGFSPNWNAMSTLGLTGAGLVEEKTNDFYMDNVNFTATKVIKVVAGNSWCASLDVNGVVRAWGYNMALLDGSRESETVIEIDPYTSTAKVKDIAALQQHLVIVDENGMMFAIGPDQRSFINYQIPTWQSMKSIDSVLTFDEDRNQISNEILFGLTQDGIPKVWAYDNGVTSDHVGSDGFQIVDEAPSTSGVAKIICQERLAAVVWEDGSMRFWGPDNPSSDLEYFNSNYAYNVKDVQISMRGDIAVLYKNGELDVKQKNSFWNNFLSIEQVSAGWKHIVYRDIGGYVGCIGDNTYGQLNAPRSVKGVVQVFAGGQWSVAQLPDGSLVWWGGESNGVSPS